MQYIHTDEEETASGDWWRTAAIQERNQSVSLPVSTEDFFGKNADYVVVNNGDFAQTRRRLRRNQTIWDFVALPAEAAETVFMWAQIIPSSGGCRHQRKENRIEFSELTGKDIDGILITHEHSDHIKGLGVIARKHQIPVYATEGTVEAFISHESGKMPEGFFVRYTKMSLLRLMIWQWILLRSLMMLHSP